MKHEEILKREDDLASWRLATLLAFNGFLISYLGWANSGSTHYGFIIQIIPWLGLAISCSVTFVSFLSARVKYELHTTWKSGESPISKSSSKFKYYMGQLLGPYFLSSFLLCVFWVAVLLQDYVGKT